MRYTKQDAWMLSSFTLGTVQLGMQYGLGGKRPSEEEAYAVLDNAAEIGINCLDTANNYGDSESIIGQWLSREKQKGNPLPRIITKIGQFSRNSYGSIRDDIRRQAETCIRTLGVDRLDGLMIHGFPEYEQNQEVIGRTFEELKTERIIEKSGISAYSHHDYRMIAQSGFDMVQIPLNIFDWRQIESGGIEALADSEMILFVRSVFLQGLVFHTEEDLDPRMSFCFPYLREFQKLCKEFEMSPAVLALSFVMSISGVSSIVIGCDNSEQVRQNGQLFDQAILLDSTQLEMIRRQFSGIDPRVINPGLWYNHT